MQFIGFVCRNYCLYTDHRYNKRLQRLQIFKINAFVNLSTFIILINLIWNELCRIARVIRNRRQEAKHFTYLLRLNLRLIDWDVEIYTTVDTLTGFLWGLLCSNCLGMNFADCCSHERTRISNLHELQNYSIQSLQTNRLKQCRRLLSTFVFS